MELLIATILVSAAIAIYLTALVCRRSLARGRRPPFWPAVVATLCAPIFIIVANERGELFSHRFWQGNAKGEPLTLLVIFVCICSIATIIPTITVVALYRRKLKC